MSKIVKHDFDPANPPSLTDTEKADIAALAALDDAAIDYGDLAPLSDDAWATARRNPHFRPIKQQITLRIDADLLAWFKDNTPDGRGYQSDINAALRSHVEAKQRKAG
ncbi:BrnA antitoxin family protein [Oryzibacter oryziterrae]|uniref:BrnA antitoxin family protein n=1 Tax=Oryzibacter oryziterrae TaxID=2766474 RepID=UPI001F1F53DE|nr:BrnA antitoxin family protein [Oryzibacter oryziterrae]